MHLHDRTKNDPITVKNRNVDESECPNIQSPSAADAFIKGLSAGFNRKMNERFGELIVSGNMWALALDLGLHRDPKVAFRSSWALEWAFFNDRGAFSPHMAHFIGNFLKATNGSVHRHYTKMMWDVLHRGMLVPDAAQAEQIAEKTFDLLISPATRTAVKVWCMEILFELAPHLDWVGEQLCETVRQIMENEPSRGLANRACKMLKRIDEHRNG